jgi:hypothetical protein
MPWPVLNVATIMGQTNHRSADTQQAEGGGDDQRPGEQERIADLRARIAATPPKREREQNEHSNALDPRQRRRSRRASIGDTMGVPISRPSASVVHRKSRPARQTRRPPGLTGRRGRRREQAR